VREKKKLNHTRPIRDIKKKKEEKLSNQEKNSPKKIFFFLGLLEN